METTTINDKGFQDRLAQLADALDKDPQVVIADESRLFLKMAINLTPPKNKAQGEQAINDDLGRIVSGGNESFLNHVVDVFGADSVRGYQTNKRGEKYLLEMGHVSPTGEGLAAFHQKNRTKRGRVTMAGQFTRDIGRWKARDKWVVGYGALAAYKQKVMARVGMRKGGWLRAYYEVGGKLPRWIQRHAARGLGRVQNNLATPGHPSIVMASHAPGVMDDERILRDTFRARREAIGKRIKLVLSGYSADVKAGMKIRPNAKRSVD